jgi:RNA polymerase sigma factor (TIGR02999 family)
MRNDGAVAITDGADTPFPSSQSPSPVPTPHGPAPAAPALPVAPPDQALLDPSVRQPSESQLSFEALFKQVYDELRELAATYLRRESPDHTLQPTALVHEAYMRLIEQQALQRPRCREQFLGLACTMMRRILVDHVRGRRALKRGGEGVRLSLISDQLIWKHPSIDLMALNEALEDLDRLSGRQRQVVEMRFFGGMTELEIAAALGIAERTVRADWAMARAWLLIRLEGAAAA